MTEGIEQLREDFRSFHEECVRCCIIFNTHQALFDSGKEIDSLLRESAGKFFYNYSIISQEYHVMVVGRLTDKARSGARKNLTVSYFEECLREQDLLTSEVTQVAQRLKEYRRRIVISRNKLVAHRDVASLRNPPSPTQWPVEEAISFHRDLNEFRNLVGGIIGEEPISFHSIKPHTFPLLRTLKMGRASLEGSE